MKTESNAPLSLLLTADDFGLSPGVNRDIAALVRRGSLDAVSLFAHSPFVDDALDEWSRTLDELNQKSAANDSVNDSVNDSANDSPNDSASQVGRNAPTPAPSLGLHFCLTSGRPVSKPNDVSLLVDRDGLFRNGFLSLWRLLRSSDGAEATRQIRREFEAQVRRIDEATAARGLVWDRIDSHCHLHAIPEIFEIVASEARKRGCFLRIPRERIGRPERLFRSIGRDLGIGLAKKLLLQTLLSRSKSTFPEFFAATEYFGVVDSGKMNRRRLRAIFAEIAAETRKTAGTSGTAETAGTAGTTGTTKNAAKTFEINAHPWRIGAFSDADADRFGASRDDRKFATSPRRAVEWETLALLDG